MRGRRPVLWGLCLVVLLGIGCASVPRPVEPFVDPAQALRFHALAREHVRGIRAEARVDQRGPEGRIKGTVLMFVERPGRVRFDVMTQFGPAATLTSDGERFAYSDLRKRRFLSGPTCPQNIARLLNIPFSVEDTTLLLLGGTPVLAHDRASIAWHDDGFYRLKVLGRGGLRQEVDFGIGERDAVLAPARQTLRLLRSEIYDASGKTRWRVTYDDYRPLAVGSVRVAMPFEVRVEQPRFGADTLIRFKAMRFEAAAPAEAFVQVPAPGMQEEVANCD